MAHDVILPVPGSSASPGALVVPAAMADAGKAAIRRYIEFFTANIRNPNTRLAYARACGGFLTWCERLGLALSLIQPVHVATWIEQLSRDERSAPTVKQQLAAVRMLFDWLVVGQVVAHNPAAAVRGPKHSLAKDKTSMLSREEAKALIAAIDATCLVGLRDRALIGVLLYAFTRVGAATAMRVPDYYPVGKHWWLRLHEKGGKEHEMPAHHTLQDWLDAYLGASGIGGDRKGFLFRTADGRSGRLTGNGMTQADAYRMIQRRAVAAGAPPASAATRGVPAASPPTSRTAAYDRVARIGVRGAVTQTPSGVRRFGHSSGVRIPTCG